MSCACKNEKENIVRDEETLRSFREYFIRRMTVDNPKDRRRKDFNQSIFSWFDDETVKTPETTFQVWTPMSMDMVLTCYDDAMRDFKKRYCDEHELTMFEKPFEEEKKK